MSEKFNERGFFAHTGWKLNKNFRETRREQLIVDSQTLDIVKTNIGTKVEIKKSVMAAIASSSIPRWG